MLCVPVPGAINAVAASVMVAVIAEAAPRAMAPRNVRTATSIERRVLRMRQIKYNTVAGEGERQAILSLLCDCTTRRLSDWGSAVRRTGREWNTRFRSLPRRGDRHAVLRPIALAVRRTRGPHRSGRAAGRDDGVQRFPCPRSVIDQGRRRVDP